MELFPDAGRLPIPQPPPAGHRATTTQLLGGQQPPRDPSAEHIDAAADYGPVLDPGSAARLGVAEALPAVESESASPGLGHTGSPSQTLGSYQPAVQVEAQSLD
jgi:hypothetical protein